MQALMIKSTLCTMCTPIQLRSMEMAEGCCNTLGDGVGGTATAAPYFNFYMKFDHLKLGMNIFELVTYCVLSMSSSHLPHAIGDKLHQPQTYHFSQKEFGKTSVVKRSFQPQWVQRWSWLLYTWLFASLYYGLPKQTSSFSFKY